MNIRIRKHQVSQLMLKCSVRPIPLDRIAIQRAKKESIEISTTSDTHQVNERFEKSHT